MFPTDMCHFKVDCCERFKNFYKFILKYFSVCRHDIPEYFSYKWILKLQANIPADSHLELFYGFLIQLFL